MCQSVPVRVVTYNLLHGVPLRDRIAAAQGSGEEVEVPELGAPQGTPAPPPDGSANGVEQMNRHIWSPDVPDPADLLRSIEELLAEGPIDVIALQEVDRFQMRTGGVDQARLVAEAIGAKYWRFAASVRGTPGIASEGAAWVPATGADDLPEDRSEPARAPRGSAKDGPRYGVALISRYPVQRWRVKRFPPAPVSLPLMAPTATGRPKAVKVPDEPRTAISAIVELPYADVTIATSHLTFVPGYNTRQLTQVRAFLAGSPRPMVLLGDFNTPGGIPGLVTGWDQVARTPTYPVARPRVQFDHIMADGWTDEAIAAARASARAIPLPVSDHCALLADFPDP
jgi:endonuclease/exonuclease/phosphatase family metal-dependent hydrolase